MKRSKFRPYWSLALLLLISIVAGCTTMNSPLVDCCNKEDVYSLDRLTQPAGADETFIVLALSGGGTRAAALSYGVLKKLYEVEIPKTDKTVLDEVDVISTVSGGSFTGAYYALFGKHIFDDFKDKFLNRNIEEELAWSIFNPYNAVRLLSPYFSRNDLAAELYNRTIFDEKTYGDLAKQGQRPFLIINATNLYTGSRFEFTSEQFRYLGSDILSYPVARAVAASSAFPYLLTPITLENYPLQQKDPCKCEKITGENKSALDPDTFRSNKPRYYASYYNTLYQDNEKHPYVHLMDGGLADNLGLRAIDDSFVRGDIRKRISKSTIQRIAVIVVNAKTAKKEDFDQSKSPPGLVTIGVKTATIPMDNYTSETIEEFRKLLTDRIETELRERSKGGSLAGGKMKLYFIDLGFENLADPKDRDYFLNLPTSFCLKPDQIENLIKVGGQLLMQHPKFRDFICEFYDNPAEKDACIKKFEQQ